MPSAGAVCPPLIVPVRRHVTGLATNKIDTTTLIEITTETPDCKLYFTSDGTKPSPFQRKIGGRELTFKYSAPFTLKAGKRTLKAVAVTRDGIKESDVMTKQFVVEYVGQVKHADSTTDYYSTEDYTSFFESSDLDTDTTCKSSSSACTLKNKRKPKRSKSPTRSKSPMRASLRSSLKKSPKEAWASSHTFDNFGAEDGRHSPPQPPLPEGPFNPTNYSGTQINVWGAPPGSWPGMNANNGAVTFGVPVPNNPYPTQTGFLTENMISSCNPENRHVTVGDIRQMMNKQRPAIEEPPKEPPKAIELPPAPKEPELEAVSPGNGDFKGNIRHVYAHMLEFAKNNKDFRLRVAEPKIGRMHEAKFEDEGDGYRITLVMGKPGVPRE